ncbi:MAG: pentapeptide repeat-containing protein, partial [Campylobacter sp.]|nr:pentapeptide repeat-containing protein [Campylobacter sp.]
MDIKQEIEKIFENSEITYDNNRICISNNKDIKEQYCDYYDFIRKIENIKEITKQDNKIVSCIYFIKFNFSHSVFQLNNNENINLSFQDCKFDKIYGYQINHNGEYIFDECDINSINFSKSFSHIIKFENCKIKKVKIYDCEILNRLSFYKSTFESDFHFENCKVKNLVDFSNVKFMDNAYFNNTEFSDYVDFHEAEFNAVAGFYGVAFEKFINFSNAIFKDFDKINFVNLNIEKINFIDIKNAIELNYKDKLQKREIEKLNNQKKETENIEKKIKQLKERLNSTLQKIKELKEKIKKDGKLYKNYIGFKVFKQQLKLLNIEKQKLNALVKQNKKEIRLLNNRKKIANNEFEIIKLKYKAKWANNFRDSFRIIKHSLIEIDNNLEASNFHKLELYAKEIELDYITELERYRNKNISFVISNLSESESFARKHMEDLIASKIKEIKINIKNYKQNNDNRWKNLKYFFDFFILAFYRNTSEHHTDFIRILNFTITIIALFGSIAYLQKNAIEYNLFIAISVFFVYFIFDIFSYKGDSYKNTIYDIFSKLFFISLIVLFILAKIFADKNIFNDYADTIIFGISYLVYLGLIVYGYKFKKFRTASSFVSYPIFFIMLFAFTSLIIPYANLNSNSQNQYLQTKLSQANKDEIINLASTINPEFNAT